MAERLFSTVLAEHARGHTDLRLTAELRKAIKAARKHNRKAELLLKVGVSLEKGNIVLAFGETTKLPAEEPDRMMYFLNDEGDPVLENPHQTAMDLRELQEA